jgi:Protein of unknown function (DUF3558)
VWIRRALLVGVVLLVGGCTSVVGGQSAPVGSSESTGTQLPARPREVRLDGVDPCSLLTAEQRAELGLDGRPVFDEGPSRLYNGEVPLCAIRGFEPRAILVGVSLVTTAGIELYTSGDLLVELRPMQVRGFPALLAVETRNADSCSVIVDVAPGQLLDIQFRDGGREPPIPQPQLCQDAEVAADAVMATLLAR